MTTHFPKSLLVSLALGSGLALGCIITTGGNSNPDCPSGSNNHELNDTCYCDAGFQWEDANDINNLNCIDAMPKGTTDCNEAHNIVIDNQCYCDDGFDWCNPADATDYTCCENPGHTGGTGGSDTNAGTDTGMDSGTGSTGNTGVDSSTGADTGSATGGEPDPADCTSENEGAGFCNNTDMDHPENSRYWVCTGGTWMENTTAGDESCMFDMYDFSYGCVDTGDAVQFVCGMGPGTACEGDTSMCVDADQVQYCQYNKLTQDSCMRICTEVGDDMGVTYDHGECSMDSMDCFCCDMGDMGCPV